MAGDPYVRMSLAMARWAPLVACSITTRWAWAAMWASREMKSACSGLFPGSVGMVAEVASMSFGEAVAAVDELVEKQLIEHDASHRLIRYTRLPDRFDRPDNGNCLVGWWRGFVLLPPCATRDRHVSLIRWMCGEALSKDHEKVWATTFGTISSPDAKTGTSSTVSQVPVLSSSQPELFDSADLRNHGATVPGTVSIGIGIGQGLRDESTREGSYPQAGLGGRRPPLRSVDAPTDLTDGAKEMLAALGEASGGRVGVDLIDTRLYAPLNLVASVCAQKGLRKADFDLAGRFLRAGGLAYRDDLGANWVSRPGNVLDVVMNARRWQKGELRLEGDSDPEPTDPRPPSAFTTGLRSL